MSLDLFLSASPIIQIHIVTAIGAVVLGAAVLFGKKCTPHHKTLGRVFVMLMAITAISSFFIWTIRMWSLFSPIHILSVMTLFGLWRAIGYARAHDIKAHKRTMRILFFGALLGAGLFTFLPGRLMHRIAFGSDGASMVELAVLLAVAATLAASGVLLARKPGGWPLWRTRRHM